MQDNTYWVVSTEQVSCELQGDMAILNLKDSTYYGLNPVGAYVWQLLQNPVSVGNLRQSILNEYEADPERVQQDLVALLTKLESHQLIAIHHENDH